MKIALTGLAQIPIMGGVEIHSWELARNLAAVGHEVHLYGVRNYKGIVNPAEEEREGVRIHRLSGSLNLGRYRFWEFAQRRIARAIAASHAQQPFDLLHGHSVYPPGYSVFLAARMTGVPYIITSHGIEIMLWSRNPLYQRYRLYNTRRIFRSAARVIAVSQELKQLSQQCGAHPERTVVFANATNVDRFQPDLDGSTLRRQLSYRDDDVVVISVRRLAPKNGVQYLVDCAAHINPTHPQVKFLICGDGPVKPDMQQRIDDLGLQDCFHFAGSVDNALIPEHIAASDIAVFPSLAEATSIACLECMATGTPVVTSNVGGLPEIVEDGINGLLVDYLKTDSSFIDYGLPLQVVQRFSAAITKLADDSALRRRLGENGSRIVRERFNWQSYVDRIIPLYEEAIHAAGTPTSGG